MRHIAILTVALALPATLAAEATRLVTLDQLRWKGRVILVDGLCDQSVRELQARKADIDDRQILWFCVEGNEVRTNFTGELDTGFLTHLREVFFGKTGLPILLIGKDGGIKSRDSSLNIDDYLAQIDGMPMRRAEMGQ